VSGRTEMYCDGLSPQGYPGYNAHPGSAPYKVVVPFIEAIHNPPRCKTHDRPYLTIGGYRLSHLADAIRRTGEVAADCQPSYGFEQGAWCNPHGFSGRASDFDGDGHCPHWRLAQWIARRHAELT